MTHCRECRLDLTKHNRHIKATTRHTRHCLRCCDLHRCARPCPASAGRLASLVDPRAIGDAMRCPIPAVLRLFQEKNATALFATATRGQSGMRTLLGTRSLERTRISLVEGGTRYLQGNKRRFEKHCSRPSRLIAGINATSESLTSGRWQSKRRAAWQHSKSNETRSGRMHSLGGAQV
jgi:hypothetical protein